MAVNQLLHLSHNSDDEFYFGVLRAHGWNVEQTTNLADTLKLLSAKNFPLGVLRLRRTDEFSIDQLNIFLDAAGDIPWVAVVEPELLDDSRMAELIYGRCDEQLVCTQNLEAQTFALGQIISRLVSEQPAPPTLMDLRTARDAAEKQAIEVALEHSPTNMTKAASQLGISRMTLYRLLHKHGLAEEHTRSA